MEPPVIAAIITGSCGLTGVVLTVYFTHRKKGKKEKPPEPAQRQDNSQNAMQMAGVSVGGNQMNITGGVHYGAPQAVQSAIHQDQPGQSYRLGEVMDEHLDWRKSRDYFKRSAAEHEQATGPVSFDRANALNEAGKKHCELAEYQEAIECWLEAEAILREKPEENQANIAGVYNNIAVVYRKQGEYDKALEWYFKALVIKEKVLGKEHPSTAMTYYNIAIVYGDQGKYDRVLKFYIKAYRIVLDKFGQEHPETMKYREIMEEAHKATKSKQPFEDWLNQQLSKTT